MNSGILVYTYNMTDHNFKNAVEMRRRGASYSEISKALSISRATACGWLKNLKLTEDEKGILHKNISDRRNRGRLQASMTRRVQRVYKDKVAYDTAQKEFQTLSKDPFFMFGIGMSGIEKAKRGCRLYQFTAQGVETVLMMLKWVEKYLGVHKKELSYRVFIAHSHKNLSVQAYWMKTLGISEGNFQKTVVLSHKKNEKEGDYAGSVAFTVSRQAVVRKIIAWQKLVMMYYS